VRFGTHLDPEYEGTVSVNIVEAEEKCNEKAAGGTDCPSPPDDSRRNDATRCHARVVRHDCCFAEPKPWAFARHAANVKIPECLSHFGPDAQ